MKKIILLTTALTLGGGFALAQRDLGISPGTGGGVAAPCNATSCPGSGVNCCKDLDNNTLFYKGK